MRNDLLAFTDKLGTKKVVLGVSGGKDSTVIAAFCSKVLGPENVFGVMMPNGIQKDIADSRQAIHDSGICSYAVDISGSYEKLIDQLHFNGLKESEDAKINLPPRLRMCTLYAIAQTIDGIVLNSDNLGEIVCGYYSIFGDGAGSYGPIRDLTVPEVLELGKFLGVKDNLLFKKPGDGLQALGDEDRLGFTYEEVHKLVRFGDCDPLVKDKIIDRYKKNKFKSDLIRISHPVIGLPNFFDEEDI